MCSRDFDKALVSLDDALHLDSSPAIRALRDEYEKKQALDYQYKGEVAMASSDYDQAVKCLLKAELDPDSTEIREELLAEKRQQSQRLVLQETFRQKLGN